MLSMEQLTTFFGWCVVINFGLLMIAAIALSLLQGPMLRLHTAITGLSEEELRTGYFRFLANYKMMALILSFAPWLALEIMAG